MTTTGTATQIHRISWFVYAGRDLIRHTAGMRGQWNYEARCSCGWETRTGGATKASVQRDVSDHKWDAANA